MSDEQATQEQQAPKAKSITMRLEPEENDKLNEVYKQVVGEHGYKFFDERGVRNSPGGLSKVLLMGRIDELLAPEEDE